MMRRGGENWNVDERVNEMAKLIDIDDAEQNVRRVRSGAVLSAKKTSKINRSYRAASKEAAQIIAAYIVNFPESLADAANELRQDERWKEIVKKFHPWKGYPCPKEFFQ